MTFTIGQGPKGRAPRTSFRPSPPRHPSPGGLGHRGSNPPCCLCANTPPPHGGCRGESARVSLASGHERWGGRGRACSSSTPPPRDAERYWPGHREETLAGGESTGTVTAAATEPRPPQAVGSMPEAGSRPTRTLVPASSETNQRWFTERPPRYFDREGQPVGGMQADGTTIAGSPVTALIGLSRTPAASAPGRPGGRPAAWSDTRGLERFAIHQIDQRLPDCCAPVDAAAILCVEVEHLDLHRLLEPRFHVTAPEILPRRDQLRQRLDRARRARAASNMRRTPAAARSCSTARSASASSDRRRSIARRPRRAPRGEHRQLPLDHAVARGGLRIFPEQIAQHPDSHCRRAPPPPSAASGFASIFPRLSAVARFSGSNPRMIDSTTAASSTDLACTPTRSCVNEIGITPARLTSPCEGAMPTMPVLLAGPRIESPVSVPSPTVAYPRAHRHRRAAARSAGAVREVEGLRICPPSELSPQSSSPARRGWS